MGDSDSEVILWDSYSVAMKSTPGVFSRTPPGSLLVHSLYGDECGRRGQIESTGYLDTVKCLKGVEKGETDSSGPLLPIQKQSKNPIAPLYGPVGPSLWGQSDP